jgi:hypothetical protein
VVQIAAIGPASVAPPLGTQHDKRQAARIRGLRSRGLFVAPRIGAAVDVGLRADMVCSMHPHGISQDERTCL